MRGVERAPTLAGELHELEDHREAGYAAAAALGLSMSQPHLSELNLDWIGGALVFFSARETYRNENAAFLDRLVDNFRLMSRRHM